MFLGWFIHFSRPPCEESVCICEIWESRSLASAIPLQIMHDQIVSSSIVKGGEMSGEIFSINRSRAWRVACLLVIAFGYLKLASIGFAASVSGSKTTNVTIPDNGAWVNSMLTISGAPAGAIVTSVEVNFRCVHPYSGDLQVDLEVGAYPNTKRLWDNEGAGVDNPSRTTTTSAFNGLPVNNSWYLYARDTSAMDSGYIDEWTITIYYTGTTDTTDPVVTAFNVTPTSITQGQAVSITYSATDSGGLNRVELYRAPGGTTPPSTGWVKIDTKTASGSSTSGSFTNVPPTGTYWYGVTVFDNAGRQGTYASKKVTVVAPDTTKPTFSAFSVSPTSLTQGNPVTVSYTVSDSGGSGLAYSQLWRAPDNGGVPGAWAQVGSNATLSGNGPTSRSFTDTPPVGTYWYGVHANDNAGNFGEQKVNGGFNPVKVTVTAPLGDLAVTLTKPDGSAAPIGTSPATPRFALFTNPSLVISERNPAVFSNVAAGTYWVEGYHTGTFWGEEFWNSEQKQVLANQTNTLVLTRKYPRATTVEMYDNATNQKILPGQSIAAGTTVRFEVTVQNDVPNLSLNTQVRFTLDYNRDLSYDYDSGLSATQVIASSGGKKTYVFPVTLNGRSTGQLYYALEVKSTIQTTTGNEVRRTDSWGWTQACRTALISTISGVLDPPLTTPPEFFFASKVYLQLYQKEINAIINPNLQTWIIIHGRTGSSSNPWVVDLAKAITNSLPNDQVILLDWTDAADAPYISTNEEDWIPAVAQWAAIELRKYGFSGEKLNLIGHSWGGNMCAELAEEVGNLTGSDGVNTIIALDPAENGTGFYNPEDTNSDNGMREVDFARNSRFSWAFHSSDFGSGKTPVTADESIGVHVQIPPLGFTANDFYQRTALQHSAVNDLFVWILNNPSHIIGSRFKLSRILGTSSQKFGPWKPDRLEIELDYETTKVAGYEAEIFTDDTGKVPTTLGYWKETAPGYVDYFWEPSTSDSLKPTVLIYLPISSSTYSTSSGSINMSGAASDNVGVTQVTWSNDRGGSGTASGTTSWSVSGIALSSGQNILTVTARDAAGNTQTDILTVTYNAAPVTTYTVTPSAGANGSISPNSVQTVNSGGNAAFTATPLTGYVVDQWLVGGSVVQTGGNSYTLSNVTANKTVRVTFKVAPVATYTVTPSAGANGSISPNSVQTVNIGGSASFTALPNTGYMVDKWLVGGSVVQTGGNSYTISNIQSNRSVLVTFTPLPPNSRILNLSGALSFGDVMVGQSATRTFTITNNGNAALTVSSLSYPAGFSGNWSSGTIAANGGTRTVTVTFAPGAAVGYGGTVTVNSDLTSGLNTLSAAGIGVVVESFSSWASNLPEGRSGPSDEAYDDGVANLLRYALGMDADQRATSGDLPVTDWTTIQGKNYLSLTFTRPANKPDIDYLVQCSSDMNIWNPAEFVENVDNGDGTVTVTHRHTSSISSSGGGYMRLRVRGL
jgi:subtilisin-like proprotein convertase family protein/pimeloyl-ACP methyl ester carboxylesterase